MTMTATGDLLYLPVPSPGPSPVTKFKLLERSVPERNPSEQHRIYRMPRQDYQRVTYGTSGYAAHQPVTGRIIDIRI